VSKGLAKTITLYSVFVPIEHAVRFLKDTCNIFVSPFLVKSLVFRIGKKISINAQEDLTEKELKEVYSETKKADVGYVQADGSFVPIRGEKSREYKENKLGMMFTSNDMEKRISRKGKEIYKIKKKKFAISLAKGVDHFEKVLVKAATMSGVTFAKTLIFLSDGAEWLRHLQERKFPQAVRILDWYHVTEHLWQTAVQLFGPDNKEKCHAWVDPIKALIWDGEIDKALVVIRKFATETKKNSTPVWNLYNYYFKNKSAMNYAEYRLRGYYIGSGAVESANNYLVANRMKLAGMRWTIPNADAMLWLRAEYFQDTWCEFWEKLDLKHDLRLSEVA